MKCHSINDRRNCLTTTESRSLEVFGVQMYGSNCAWCPNGPCTVISKGKCEPSNWLVAIGVREFDTCFKGI